MTASLPSVLALLALLATLLGATVWTAPPAAACSCVSAPPRQLLAGAEVVVVATFEDDLSETDEPETSAAARVELVIQGRANDRVIVTTSGSSSACGLTGPAAGETWLLAGTVSPGATSLSVSSCGGSRYADDAAVARAERQFGPGVVAGPTPDADPSEAPPAWVWLTGGAAVLLLAVVVGAVVLQRRSR